MSSELVETSRLFARRNAAVKPDWIEAAAAHLVSRSYSEPHWSAKRGATVAVERVTLYGIPLVIGRTVDYGRIDPPLCRELFIRGALVEGEWSTRHRFWHANAAALKAAEEVEERSRRRGLVIDDEGLFASTTPASRPTSRRYGTSTPGGRRHRGRRRTCSRSPPPTSTWPARTCPTRATSRCAGARDPR